MIEIHWINKKNWKLLNNQKKRKYLKNFDYFLEWMNKINNYLTHYFIDHNFCARCFTIIHFYREWEKFDNECRSVHEKSQVEYV